MAEAPALLTEGEAAQRLRVCSRTLRKERKAGRLPYVLIGRRILYAPSDLETLVERARTVQTPTTTGRKTTGKVAKGQRSGVIVPFSQRPDCR